MTGLPELNLYGKLKAAGVPLDSHESDLYALVMPESIALVEAAIQRGELHRFGTSKFVSRVDGKLWYDLAFMNSPWWEARQKG